MSDGDDERQQRSDGGDDGTHTHTHALSRANNIYFHLVHLVRATMKIESAQKNIEYTESINNSNLFIDAHTHHSWSEKNKIIIRRRKTRTQFWLGWGAGGAQRIMRIATQNYTKNQNEIMNFQFQYTADHSHTATHGTAKEKKERK